MALQKTLTRTGDVDVPNAYNKVTDVILQAHGTSRAQYVISTYLDKATADADGKVISQETFKCDVDKRTDLIAQCYADAKLSLFAGSEDV